MKGSMTVPRDETWMALDKKIKEVRGRKTLEPFEFRPTVSPRRTSKKEVTREQIKEATEKYLAEGGDIHRTDVPPPSTETKVNLERDLNDDLDIRKYTDSRED